jgi:6-phosphogluconolactonase
MAATAFLFIGSLTTPTPYFRTARGKGISVYEFDPDGGACRPISVADGIDNPTYLTFDRRRSCLYANSEVAGWNAGTVTACRFDAANGSLRVINRQSTLGGIAAHNSLSRDGRFLLVANYGDGPAEQVDRSIAVFPLRDDGGLDPACGSLAHRGSGPNKERQERPHAHCVVASPDGGFVVVADLGTDAVLCHRLGADGALTPDPGPFLLPTGSGPRQIAFHPSGRVVCVVNELNSTIAALAYDGAGHFGVIATVPTIPAAARGENHPSELQFSRDGRFLYGSNRGHDSIVIYSVDSATGRLALIGHQPCGGITPRSFAIDPTGRWLLVANQNSDSIAIFRIDPQSGGLSDTGRRIEVGTPMCVKFGAA